MKAIHSMAAFQHLDIYNMCHWTLTWIALGSFECTQTNAESHAKNDFIFVSVLHHSYKDEFLLFSLTSLNEIKETSVGITVYFNTSDHTAETMLHLF